MGRLGGRLRAIIRTSGPIPFDVFMDASLYDPEDGFYARPPVGRNGHFLTSPHVSPLFGALVARQLGEAWDLLAEPKRFHVVEFAAGDGTLARQILDAAAGAPRFARALRYLAVERTPGAQERLQDAGIEVLDEGLPRRLEGVVLANELLDNLPFRLVRRTEAGARELLVGLGEGDAFVFVDAEPGPDVAALADAVPEGTIAAVGREPELWLEEAASILRRGWIVVIDYGGEGPRPPGTYRSHRSDVPLLHEPGSADITAGVDFSALTRRGRELGLPVWGPVTQRDALLALGFGARAERERDRTAAARDAGRHLEATRIWAARSRESLLIDPAGLGGLQVVVFGVGDVPQLTATRERSSGTP